MASKASPSSAIIFLKRLVYAWPFLESTPARECASVYLSRAEGWPVPVVVRGGLGCAPPATQGAPAEEVVKVDGAGAVGVHRLEGRVHLLLGEAPLRSARGLGGDGADRHSCAEARRAVEARVL